MKKKFRIVLLAAMLLCLAACEKDKDDKNDKEPTAAGAEKNGAVTEAAGEYPGEENGLVFWLNQQEWTEPVGSYDGVLFLDLVTLPVDIRKLDEIAAPYRMFAEGIDGLNDPVDTERIGELLELEYNIFPGKEAVIAALLDTEASEEESQELHERQKECGLDSIVICNLSEEALPIKTCYEKGWWKIEAYDEGALNMEFEKSDDEYQKDMLDAVVRTFGSPTYLRATSPEERFYEKIAKNDAMVLYSLVYEYADYTLVIGVSEFLMYESGGKIYNDQRAEITDIWYYSAACWERMKETDEEHYLFKARRQK